MLMMKRMMMQIQQEKHHNEIHIRKWSENEPALSWAWGLSVCPQVKPKLQQTHGAKGIVWRGIHSPTTKRNRLHRNRRWHALSMLLRRKLRWIYQLHNTFSNALHLTSMVWVFVGRHSRLCLVEEELLQPVQWGFWGPDAHFMTYHDIDVSRSC